ncbi:preprotein translocase subunit YajC [Halomonas sp. Bachu 37]|uniref:preprotein translocase subunit YajC n=1 Tax=Halomonas kashgarensis TaxID=3084920 RepID=UPI003216B16E
MEWLIIVLILMFVAAPVMWLKPSPRQKRLVKLRRELGQQGVTIKLEKPPLHEFKGTMPAYRWRYPEQAPGPDFTLVRDSHASEALETYLPGWRWRVAPLRPLPESAHPFFARLLERLPQDALIIESDPQALTLWWWESQNEERFQQYLDDFKGLRDALAGHSDQPRTQPMGPLDTSE